MVWIPKVNMTLGTVGSKVSHIKRFSKKEVHQKAKEKIENYTSDFGRLLFELSIVLATRDGASIVTNVHVNEAYHMLKSKNHEHKVNMIMRAVGPILFGAFITGFTSAMHAGDKNMIIFFTILGMIGISLFIFGLTQE